MMTFISDRQAILAGLLDSGRTASPWLKGSEGQGPRRALEHREY